MNNNSVRSQLILVVSALVATILVIALLGAWQLMRTNDEIQQLANVTTRVTDLTSQIRVAMMDTIRMEKNAVLSPDDAQTLRFVTQAGERSATVDRLVPQLGQLLGRADDDEANAVFSTFEPAWQGFKANHNEVLRLAILNTNVKANELLEGDYRGHKLALDRALLALQSRAQQMLANERSPGAIRKSLERELALRQWLWVNQRLLTLLYEHIAESDETEMVRLDGEVNLMLTSLEEGLQAIRPLLDDADRLTLGQSDPDLAALKAIQVKIRELSHTNSNSKSARMTLTTSVERGTACDEILVRLNGLMSARVDAGRDAVQAAYMLGMRIIAGVSLFGIVGGLFIARRLIGVISGVIVDIGHLARQINVSALELSGVSHQLLAQSEEMSTQSGFVSGSTDQLTININTMAAAAEQMSMNVASISSASEEISVNVGAVSTAAGLASGNVESVVRTIDQTTRSLEIVAQDAGEGAKMTAQASALAASATETMNSLDHSASEIGKITEMIKLIAMQTNMLALNAMIEATSAGEAGKGFAVVANEIKQLANQSGKAAEDIARMIEGIQGNTRSAVAVIDTVATTISEINASSERIYQAVESQTDTAVKSAEKLMGASQGVADIARSITEVAKGAIDMSRNASEAARAATDVSQNASGAAHGAQDIAVNIRGVSQATLQNTASAEQVNQTATHLSAISTNLNQIVRRFRVRSSDDAA